ncbi:unnamed protein product, partial [Discosporangium mesarthrocarpum]
RDKYQATPLLLCAECGHAEGVGELLVEGADVNATDENLYNALHLACYYGHSEVVQMLLSAGVDVLVRWGG